VHCFFFYCYGDHRDLPSFPTRRSSDLAASILLPTFEAPTWVMKAFVVFLAFGFVISVSISWAFEATPEGLKRTENVPPDVAAALPTWSPRKFATFIIVIAAIAAGLFAYQFLRT